MVRLELEPLVEVALYEPLLKAPDSVGNECGISGADWSRTSFGVCIMSFPIDPRGGVEMSRFPRVISFIIINRPSVG